MPLEGSLVSLSSFPEKRDLFLASYRPSTRIPRVRHLCTRLTAASLGYDCEQVASLYGGSQMRMLSRARLFRKVDSERKSLQPGMRTHSHRYHLMNLLVLSLHETLSKHDSLHSLHDLPFHPFSSITQMSRTCYSSGPSKSIPRLK